MIRFEDTLLKSIFRGVCWLIYYGYCRLSITGQDNLIKGAYILCSNHSSHMDSPALMLATARPFSEFSLFAAKDYFFQPKRYQSLLSRLMHLIPIDRERPFKAIRELLKQRKVWVNSNHKFIFYPEGTRSEKEALLPFKKGAALLALLLDLPIIPVYIQGTSHTLPKGKRFILPKKIMVTIGTPIFPTTFLSSDIKNSVRCDLMTTAIYKAISDLKIQSKDQNYGNEMVGMGRGR